MLVCALSPFPVLHADRSNLLPGVKPQPSARSGAEEILPDLLPPPTERKALPAWAQGLLVKPTHLYPAGLYALAAPGQMQQGFCRVGNVSRDVGVYSLYPFHTRCYHQLVALINVGLSPRMETNDREQPSVLWSPAGLVKKCSFRFQPLTDRAAQSCFLNVPS